MSSMEQLPHPFQLRGSITRGFAAVFVVPGRHLEDCAARQERRDVVLSVLQQPFNEGARAHDRDAPVWRDREEIVVAAYDVSRHRGQCTGNELVVIRVPADRLREGLHLNKRCRGRDQIQRWTDIHTWELRRQFIADPDVFLDDLSRHDDLDCSVAPRGQDITRSPPEEHAGYEDVRVEYDSHVERTAEIAAAMSDRRSPARRAA